MAALRFVVPVCFLLDVGGCDRALGLQEYRHVGAPPRAREGGIDDPCGPLEVLTDDGECEAVGVPPDACTDGFSPDDAGGCTVVLPETDCAVGLAFLGASVCDVTFGGGMCTPDTNGYPAIGALESQTTPVLYVDAGPGTEGEGTLASPFRTIGAALGSLEGASGERPYLFVRGVFEEDVNVTRSGVTIRGCPGRAEIAGRSTTRNVADPCFPKTLEKLGGGWFRSAAICVAPGTNDVWLEGLTISGPSDGVQAFGAGNLTIRDTQLRDLGTFGIRIHSSLSAAHVLSPSEVTLERVAISSAHGVGVQSIGATLHVVDSSIQGILPLNSWDDDPRRTASGLDVPEHVKVGWARAISVHPDQWPRDGDSADPEFYRSATVDIRRTVITGAPELGIFVSGASVELDHVYVGTTKKGAKAGRGIVVERSLPLGKVATVHITSSAVEHTSDAAVDVVDSEVTLDRTTLADTGGRVGDGCSGQGIRARTLPPAEARSVVTVTNSTIAKSRQAGVFAVSSTIALDHVLVNGAEPDTESPCRVAMGDGLSFERYAEQDATDASLVAVRIEGASRAGILDAAARLNATSVMVGCNGLGVVDPASGTATRDVPGALCGCGASLAGCVTEKHPLPSWVATGPSPVWPKMQGAMTLCAAKVSLVSPRPPLPGAAFWARDRPELSPMALGPDACGRMAWPVDAATFVLWKSGFIAAGGNLALEPGLFAREYGVYPLGDVISRHFPVGAPLLSLGGLLRTSRLVVTPEALLLDPGNVPMKDGRLPPCPADPCVEAFGRPVGFVPLPEAGWTTVEIQGATCTGDRISIGAFGSASGDGTLRFEKADYGQGNVTNFFTCNPAPP